MKEIVKIKLFKEVTTEQPVNKKDDAGKDIKVLEKVTDKVQYNYIIAKPSFSLKQDATLYYEGVVAECVKKGIFTTIQLRKRFVDDGGILGITEKKTYEDFWNKLWEKKTELNKLTENEGKNKDVIKTTNDEILSILSNLQGIEERSGNSLMYEHTAEKIASDRTTVWWMLFLSYKDLGNGKFESVFGNGDFKDKLKVYEEIEAREDKYEYELVQKLLLMTSLWVFGRANTQAEFDEILEQAEKKNVISAPTDKTGNE